MKSFRSFLILLGFALVVEVSNAQIGVSNLVDKTVYTDRVTFFVTNSAGFSYLALLNDQPVPVGAAVALNQPDFYELFLWRTNTTTSAVATQYVRFIISASERVGTENGLPVQTPWPVIQSSPSEFVGAHLRVMTPRSFPANYGVPVVAWVLDDNDHAVRANGLLTAPGHASIQLKRGAGSGFLASNLPPGTINYAAQIGGISTNKTIDIEASTSWTTVSGTLSGNTVWPTNSRIHVTGPTMIPAGSSLTVQEGTIVIVNGGVEITNQGTVTISGTLDNPVVFMAATETPWGGFVENGNNITFSATGAIFTGSGQEPCWYSNSERGCSSGLTGQGSHRTEQPLISMNGANNSIFMTDSAAISLAGQFSHSAGSGPYTIRFTRFLLQRATSCGQYDNANMVVNDSAFIEFPSDSVAFEDEDHDAFYFASGTYNFTNTLIGWTKDDGIDSGGSGYGPLTYQSCWFEATFHEGNSLSGYKNVFSHDTVYYGVGQGIEDGYDSPTGRLDHCLFSANQTGVRFGDNYTSGYSYNGYMLATNCISIYNHRDLFGFNWASSGWTNSTHLSASNNWIAATNRFYPNNTIWNPATDGWRLGAFGAPGRVGVGFATRSESVAQLNASGIPIGLSRFCTNQVSVDYEIDGTDSTHVTGTLLFPQGQTRQFITATLGTNAVYRVSLKNGVNADVTRPAIYLAPPLVSPNGVATTLVASNAVWKYHDKGIDLGTAWRASNYDDSGWSSGPAQLGFGDNDEATRVSRTNSAGVVNTTVYFRSAFTVSGIQAYTNLTMRLLRDDGGVVYVNSNEVFRSSSLPPSPATISYSTLANYNLANAPADNTVDTVTLPANVFTNGQNTVAVEIHQFDSGSSDLSFLLSIIANPLPTPPRMAFTRLGDEMILLSTDPTAVVEEAADVTGPWTPLANPGIPIGVSQIGAQHFFRLRK